MALLTSREEKPLNKTRSLLDDVIYEQIQSFSALHCLHAGGGGGGGINIISETQGTY